MPRRLTIAFTGNAVLTPDYPDDLLPIPGPLTAILPGSRQRRPSTFNEHQIDAQFAFLIFPYRHIVLEQDHHRDADYKHPSAREITTGVCFLEREDMFLQTGLPTASIHFDPAPITSFPTTASTGTRHIARWKDFAPGGEATMRRDFLTSVVRDCVRISLPGGTVRARFVGEPIARVDFDYGPEPIVRPYAQEIAVELDFPDEIEEVTFGFQPFPGTTGRPTSLVLRWHDTTEMRVLIGNGAFASLLNVLSGSFLGRDHEGDFDLEFEVTHDVVACKPDLEGNLPVPRVLSREVLRVPCLAAMVAPPGAEGEMVLALMATDAARVAVPAISETASAPHAPNADPLLRRPRRPGRRTS